MNEFIVKITGDIDKYDINDIKWLIKEQYDADIELEIVKYD